MKITALTTLGLAALFGLAACGGSGSSGGGGNGSSRSITQRRWRGQAAQRAAHHIRRGRARVVGAVTQVGGQHGLGFGPAGNMRAADPLAWWL